MPSVEGHGVVRQEKYTEQWDLTTTSTTANQEIGKDTPAFKVKVTSIIVEVYLTTLSDTAKLLGDLKIRIAESNIILLHASNTSSGALFGVPIPVPEGLYIQNGQKLDAVCTPAVTDSIKWIVNIIGRKV